MLPPVWMIGGAVALAVGAAIAGYSAGADSVRADWDAAELQRQRTADADRLRRAEAAMRASTAQEAQRARLASQLTEARHALTTTLSDPIECPAAGAQAPRLADVRVPAAVVDSLRRAAGDGVDPAGPAASESVSRVR